MPLVLLGIVSVLFPLLVLYDLYLNATILKKKKVSIWLLYFFFRFLLREFQKWSIYTSYIFYCLMKYVYNKHLFYSSCRRYQFFSTLVYSSTVPNKCDLRILALFIALFWTRMFIHNVNLNIKQFIYLARIVYFEHIQNDIYKVRRNNTNGTIR